MDSSIFRSKRPTSNVQRPRGQSWNLELGTWKFIVLGALAALVVIVPLAASSTDTAMLKRIASRVDDRSGVISIEASDPVPYIASQPDPRTFVVEMRDVLAVGFADNFKVDPRVPVAGVRVENGGRHGLSLRDAVRPI